MAKSYDVAALAATVKGKVVGDEKAVISGLCSLENPRAGALSFVISGHEKEAKNSNASALLVKVGAKVPDYQGNLIRVDDPYLAYAKISGLFNSEARIDSIESNLAVP